MALHEIEFHRLIADQTENPILILILDFVETLLDDFKKILKPDTEFMNAVLASHETIYDAIAEKNGDLEEALRLLESGIEFWPNNAQARYNAGFMAQRLGLQQLPFVKIWACGQCKPGQKISLVEIGSHLGGYDRFIVISGSEQCFTQPERMMCEGQSSGHSGPPRS